MNNSLPESDQLKNEGLGLKLLDSYNYWAKKRLLFNMIVGVSGVLAIFYFGYKFSLYDFIGVVFWGVAANGLYSFGYVLESQIIVKTNSAHIAKKYRTIIFWIGTLAYVLVTIAFVRQYYEGIF